MRVGVRQAAWAALAAALAGAASAARGRRLALLDCPAGCVARTIGCDGAQEDGYGTCEGATRCECPPQGAPGYPSPPIRFPPSLPPEPAAAPAPRRPLAPVGAAAGGAQVVAAVAGAVLGVAAAAAAALLVHRACRRRARARGDTELGSAGGGGGGGGEGEGEYAARYRAAAAGAPAAPVVTWEISPPAQGTDEAPLPGERRPPAAGRAPPPP